ncbi:MAG: restriction endonuclease subunit S [Blastocatellia bacterium]|nr:restriction endonuclease subunit S [Blastocatellia bacterium]
MVKPHRRTNLNQTILKSILFPLPPLAEQQEIVRRVESLFKLADQLEGRYQKAKSYVDKLTQSILAKAFRGELVAQDPNDEPASVLLERIKQEKEAATTEKSRKVSVKRKVENKKESKEIIVENKAHINDKFVEIVKENKSSNFNKMVADIEKLGEQMTLPFIGED